MENEKLGQEPAFSFVYEKENIYGDKENVVIPGMSKRFYAACTAMQGLIASTASEDSFLNPKDIAERSFEFADELLKQENL